MRTARSTMVRALAPAVLKTLTRRAGPAELGFIHSGTFYVASGPRALPTFLAAFLSLCCPDDACSLACADPSTAPDGLVKQLLLGENP